MNDHIKEKLLILERIENGIASESDLLWYINWCNSHQPEDNIEVSLPEDQKELLFKNIASKTFSKPIYARKGIQILFSIVFFVLISCLCTTYLYQTGGNINTSNDAKIATRDNLKEEKGVVLILEDGKEVDLKKQSNGIIGEDHNNSVLKNSDSSLVYSSAGTHIEPVFNTLSVSRGHQYQLTLSDGTKVWLNASTSLRFPIDFKGQGERRVFLEGEAYFEVSKNPNSPFIVVTENQEVKVLGTHFNIKADKGRPSSETTLLEGSVLVNNEVKLIPGDQLSIANGSIKKRRVNVQDVIAWKNGYFNFDGEPIREIMEEVSKWYDVEVNYTGRMPNDKLDVTISRRKSLKEVLELLELTGLIKFKSSTDMVTVYPVKMNLH